MKLLGDPGSPRAIHWQVASLAVESQRAHAHAHVQMGVGLASFSMKRAASFASVPFRVPIRAAQRRYFPIGRQLFLYPDVVTTSAPGKASQTLGSQTCTIRPVPIEWHC